MLIRIALADMNTDYLERLHSVLDDNTELRVASYSDVDILCDAVSAGRFDVLLLDPSMYDTRLLAGGVPAIIMLAGDGNIPYECELLPRIRKYQRISAIQQQTLEICADKLKLSSGAAAGRAAVYAFYSPIGGCGKTTASLIAATRLAMHGKRTLYLNLETFPSDGCYLPQETPHGLSEVLGRIGQKDETVKLFIKGCMLTKVDNLFYLKHFDSPNDYAAMSVDDLAWLIGLFRTSGDFDCIVVDTDSCFDEKAKYIIEAADKIVMVERPDTISCAKYASLLAQSYIIEEHGFKMKRLINFFNGRESALVTDIPIIGRISALNGADCASLITNKTGTAEAGFALALAE